MKRAEVSAGIHSVMEIGCLRATAIRVICSTVSMLKGLGTRSILYFGPTFRAHTAT